MNVQIFAIAFAIAVALSGFSGWKLHAWKDAADREQYERGAAKAMEAAATEIAKIDLTSTTINRKVEHEIQTNTVYRDCVLPSSGVQLIREAYGAAPVADSKLPAPGAPALGGNDIR